MTTTGRKEIAEAVLIAALIALCTEGIKFGAEELKRHIAEKREAAKQKPGTVTP